MNQKTCKKLRKTAREMTVGMPERALINIRGQLCNVKKSTRGVYRYLKRMQSLNSRFYAPRNNHG